MGIKISDMTDAVTLLATDQYEINQGGETLRVTNQQIKDFVMNGATFTEGSVIFANSSGELDQNNDNFFWNNTDNSFSLNTTVNSYTVDGSSKKAKFVIDNESTDFDTITTKHNTGITGVEDYKLKSRGTEAAPTVIVTGDSLYNLDIAGFDGTDYSTSARMNFSSTGTIAANQVPGIFNMQLADTGGTLRTGLALNQNKAASIGSSSNIFGASALDACAAGGSNNTINGAHTFIGGGSANSATGLGAGIVASDGSTAAGEHALVLGGSQNDADGDDAVAMGNRAKANQNNSFVISDSTPSDFISLKTDSMIIRMSNGVGIGTNNPDSAALLDLSSTTKGFLPPRMTTVQRNAIASPPAGLEVYDTDLDAPVYYDGTNWIEGANDNWTVFTTTAPSNTAAAGANKIIHVTSSGNFTLSDSTKTNGNWYIIKDSTGIMIHNAAGPVIAVIPESGTIDGESSLAIDGRYGALIVYTDGTNWFSTGTNFTYSDTHTTTFTGPWAAPQGTFLTYFVNNNIAHIELPQILSTATISSPITLGTVLPVDLRPRQPVASGLMTVVDDGNDMIGRWAVDRTTGQISITTGPGNTNFTGSGTTGFNSQTLTYPLFSYNV